MQTNENFVVGRNWIVVLISTCSLFFVAPAVAQQESVGRKDEKNVANGDPHSQKQKRIMGDSDSTEEAQMKFTPSDYPKYPEKVWRYFTGILPKALFSHLQVKYNASFVTACKGNYVNRNADEYVVGFIEGKSNKGYSKVFSIDRKTQKISETLIKEYPEISSEISEYIVPVVEVYCEKNFVFSKTPVNGLPAYVYDKKKKAFVYSQKDSIDEP